MRTYIALTLACAGCFGGSVDLRPVENALAAAASVGHSASLAAAGIDTLTACVTVTQPCTNYPCNGLETLTLGNACPLPLGGVGTGTVAVGGSWTTADQTTLTMSYSVTVSDTKVGLSQAAGISVRRSGGHFAVAYSGQNIQAGAGNALAAQSAWTVDVDGRGTADPSDDVYAVNGSQQGASSGGSGQVALTGVIFDPSCRKNPIAGSAVMQEASATNVGQDVVKFHAACDGKADVAGTIGGSHSQSLTYFH